MIFFFTWEEKYLIDKKIDKWKKSFIEKYWSENIYIFWEWNFFVDRIQEVLLWWGLFDNKKFIIIKWAPKDTYTKISSWEIEKLSLFLEKHIDTFDSENVIVFVSYKPDKRTKFYKFLAKHKDIKLEEYKLFSEKKLLDYIKKTFNLTDELAHYLIEKTWTNLFNIHNELEKVLKVSNNITKALIDKYVTTNIEQDSFSLLDNFNNKNKAIQILCNLQSNDEDFFKVLWLLYWNIKNTILIIEQKELGYDAKQIASNVWAHPFVVSKILKVHKDSKVFENIFKQLIHLDYSIKSWKIDIKLWYLYLKKIFLDDD